MMNRMIRLIPFLEMKFLVFVTAEVNNIGIDKPSNMELFANAAL
jgi:hypothetical protein